MLNVQVITAGGYREPITLQQIRTNMEMESHEENLHNMIKISKMETAKDQARDAAASIRARQALQQRSGVPTGIGGGSHESQPGKLHTSSVNIIMHSSFCYSAILLRPFVLFCSVLSAIAFPLRV